MNLQANRCIDGYQDGKEKEKNLIKLLLFSYL